ncbi:MAG TPA: alpha/beta hydrolase, partial [Stenomitos sp.]
MQKQRHGGRWNCLGGMIAAFALSQAMAVPATAAERIFVNYSIFGRSLSIRALEDYARTGQLSDELLSYSRFVPQQQLAQLREGLLQTVNLSPVSVSQFLYSPTGEILLSRLSQIIQTPQGQGSFYALRSALILSAADPEGMTPLSILRYYPSPDLVVNVEDIVRVVKEANWLLDQTASVTRQIQTLSAGTPLQPPASSQLLALRQPGPLKWEKYTLTLHDDSPKRLRYTRHIRTLIADAYVPQTDQPQPVVVISHGLNSDRQSYA